MLYDAPVNQSAKCLTVTAWKMGAAWSWAAETDGTAIRKRNAGGAGLVSSVLWPEPFRVLRLDACRLGGLLNGFGEARLCGQDQKRRTHHQYQTTHDCSPL
jgi:hypothetical protein